jgi:hypothetical protein
MGFVVNQQAGICISCKNPSKSTKSGHEEPLGPGAAESFPEIVFALDNPRVGLLGAFQPIFERK